MFFFLIFLKRQRLGLGVLQCRPAGKRTCIRRKNVHQNVSRNNNYSSLASLLLPTIPVCVASNKPPPPPEIDRQKFVRNVRNVQHRTNCTTKTCLEFIKLFEQYVEGDLPSDFVKCDTTLKKAAGVDVIELNGCAKCHGHVYGLDDKRTECPCCRASRYDVKDKAQEVCFLNYYFIVHSFTYYFFC